MTEIERPVKKLHPLEVNCNYDEKQVTENPIDYLRDRTEELQGLIQTGGDVYNIRWINLRGEC